MKNVIVKNTLEQLLPHTGVMQFWEETRPLMFQDDYFNWDVFFNLCTKYREENNFHPDDFLVVLTELHNDKNWFSHYSSNERTIFVHSAEWENFIYSEASYPIAYEVVANILLSLVYSKYPERANNYIHYEAIGCINDMCGWKPDISLKLRTGDICPECLNLFTQAISKDLLKQIINIFEHLRKAMLFNANYQKPLSFEESLPFSVAITKKKVSTTLEPFRKMLMLIDHFDSIIRTAVLMIASLSKTNEEILVFLAHNKLNDLPALGSWVNALAALAADIRNHDWGFQLPNDFAVAVKEVVEIANINKIVYIRNEQRGHSYIECQDSGYKETFQKCLPAIDKMEALLAPLFYRFKYYHIITLKRVESNNFSVRVYDLSGSNPTFGEVEILTTFNQIEELPIENRVYLVSPDKTKWCDLDPYIKYMECKPCMHNRLLIFDGRYMLDPYIGHRFEKNKRL